MLGLALAMFGNLLLPSGVCAAKDCDSSAAAAGQE
jgi:hypothetical protein